MLQLYTQDTTRLQLNMDRIHQKASGHIQKNLFKKLEYIKKLWQRGNQPTIY